MRPPNSTRLRETYEEEDRLRGDIERRIREAERLIREGHQADPTELLASITDEDTVETLEKRSELVQRRLALLGRVNLLATGELESMQERHDFMQRELDDVKKARRDLLEVITQVDREITETFTTAYRDVAMQFERLIKELFPGGDGRLVLTDPAEPLTSGIEIEASPGRKRVKRISLLSGGERSLDRDGVPVRDLHGASFAVLPDGRGRARARRREPASVPAAHRRLRA